jgi:hypothetical protein
MDHNKDYLLDTLEIRRAYVEWVGQAFGRESGKAENHFDYWYSEIQSKAVKDYIYHTQVSNIRVMLKGEY